MIAKVLHRVKKGFQKINRSKKLTKEKTGQLIKKVGDKINDYKMIKLLNFPLFSIFK